jgi:hypothetical protein
MRHSQALVDLFSRSFYYIIHDTVQSRDSTIGVATRYGMEGLGFQSQEVQGIIFFITHSVSYSTGNGILSLSKAAGV